MHFCSSPARTGLQPLPSTSRLATTPRSPGLGDSPDRRRRERHDRFVQPVLRARRLHRARELLALHVEPPDQRRGQGRLSVRGVLGDLAGDLDEAGPGQRPHNADGLLLEPGLRQRRLHRRFAVHQRRRQRLAAAVPGPGQQSLRLVQRRLEPGLRGHGGRTAQAFPNPPYTTLERNPESREKPFLYVNSNDRFRVFVPDVRFDSRGTTWQNGQTPGHSISIDDFFVAKPSDSVQAINNALAQGKNLIFTPGIYNVNQPIKVKRAHTVVLGLGLATLEAENGVVPMTVADVPARDLRAHLRGRRGQLTRLATGRHAACNQRRGARPQRLESTQPTRPRSTMCTSASAARMSARPTVSLEVNADNTLLDNIWAWRADHGSGVGWTSNTADTGVVVNGDNLNATGLFAEHYQKYNVIWNGENGKTIMFQNELPYDPPNQAAWQHDGVLGWAAYKVADSVKTHEGWGLGSYCFLNVDPTIHASRAFEVPVTPGVKLHDILALSITNHGTIDHVVNDFGPPTDANTTRVDVVSYP